MTERHAMRTVHKFDIPGIGVVLPLPARPTQKFLHFGLDGELDLCIWVEVNTTEPISEEWFVFIVRTGGNIPDCYLQLGTGVTPEGFVWHLYRKNGYHGNKS